MKLYRSILPICLLVSISLCLPLSARGQTRPAGGGVGGAGGGPAARMEQLHQILADLNLSADQKTKIESILAQAREDAKGLRAQLQNLEPAERMEKVKAFMTGVRDKIANELTAEQKSLFEKKLAEMRAANGGPGGAVRGAMFERFQSIVNSLDLTDDQRAKVKTLLEETSAKMREMGDANPDNRQAQVREAMQDLREQLSQVLTPAQLQTLRDKMQQGRNEAGPAAPGGEDGPLKRRRQNAPGKADVSPASKPTGTQAMMMDENKMTTDAKADGADASGSPGSAGATTSSVIDQAVAASPIEPGTAAPDLKLARLDGSPLALSSLKGRVVVLVFGSYTCPTLRAQAAALQQLYLSLGTRASLFVVYTREVHPLGGWEVERNKQEKIQITQPTNIQDRQAIARQCREALHLSMPFLIDDMNDSACAAFGVYPNGAAVINRDGTIAAAMKWAETGSLKRNIDQAVAKEYHTIPG